MKQQASLLSFFGKGTAAKKRPATTSGNAGGGGGSTASSTRPKSPARKQAKQASGGCTKTETDDADGAAARRNIRDAPAPEISTEEGPPRKISSANPAASDANGSSEKMADAPSSAMTSLAADDGNDAQKGESKATSPPSPATDATGATESSDSEEESGDDQSSAASDDSNSHACTNNGTGAIDDTKSNNGEGKSAYELLREKNIARNNARLKALGLLAGVTTNDSSANTRTARRSRPRKKARSDNNAASVPTRRSTRLRKPVVAEQGTEVEGHRDENAAAAASGGNNEGTSVEAEAEEFTVSPLFEYHMSNADSQTAMPIAKEATAGVADEGDESHQITTLVPKGPRLVPPSGLNAIYSLQFHPASWEGTSSDGNGSHGSPWLVGAGKAGLIALWDCSKSATNDDDGERYIEPVLSWKGHGGRWIADARFLPPPHPSFNEGTSDASAMVPSRLLTAANDGTVCHWDLTSTSVRTGLPQLVDRSGKGLHAGGIFSMDARIHSNCGGAYVVTGSKDKTLAVSTLDRLDDPVWRSDFHRAKVGSVCFSSSNVNPLIASASDDGLVAIHDGRLDGAKGGSGNGVVAKLEDAHFKPHSAVWRPGSDSEFLTAGLGDVIKLWDLRNIASPVASYHGHVPGNGKRLKRIHRPAFYNAASTAGSFVLSGGEGSRAISMFKLGGSNGDGNEGLQSVFSRGKLPEDVGDVGSLAVRGTDVAVAVEGGEVLMLSPRA